MSSPSQVRVHGPLEAFAPGFAEELRGVPPTARAMAPLLGYLRAIGVAPAALRPQPGTPAERLLERFGEYLASERGLAAGTVVDYVHAVRPFLAAVGGDGELDLQRLSAADVTAFVVARCPRQSRGAAKMTVTALRSLLGFLHVEGLIARSLVGAVPSAASWRLSGLPRAHRQGAARGQARVRPDARTRFLRRKVRSLAATHGGQRQ